MAELSKFIKITIYIDILAGFVYGVLYLFIPEIYSAMIESSQFSLHFWRLWGMTCALLGVMGIIGLLRNDWIMFKMIMEFVILWLIGMNILNLIILVDPAQTPASFLSELTDVIVIFFLVALNIYAYIRENKE